MCGIAGFLDVCGALSAERLAATGAAMAATLRHRGPDDSGVWVDPAAGISLAHQRLAILDLSPAGRQPMVSSCGRLVLAYNGEIYNHAELRGELESRGRRFRGHCDSETLVEACAEWGVETALGRVCGMFAFAVWDRVTRTLVLARDRVGIKPLYWARFGNLFMFGSELKALRAHGGWVPEIDRDSLAAFVRDGHVPAPYSIYRGVYKLPPGHLLVLPHTGVPEIRPYWDSREVAAAATANRFDISEAEAVDGLESLLRDAVGCHMAADVPLGAFLSGGIDSSTVVALMQAQSGRPINTYTIGFAEPRYDEARHARAVAAHLGTAHTELYAAPEHALEIIPELPRWYDEPFADSSQIPTLLLSKLTRGHVTVALSGDGGDELFAGYPRYRLALLAWYFQKLPISLRKLLSRLDARFAKLNTPPGLRQYELFGFLAEDRVRALLDPEAYQDEVTAKFFAERYFARLETLKLHPVEKLMEVTRQSWLPDYALMLADKMSMAHSIEVRVPLLDPRVVEFAATIPWRFKLSLLDTKIIFKEAFADLIPEHLLREPKRGWFSPGAKWLRYPEVAEFARQVLRPDYYAQTARLFNFANLETLLTKHLAGEYHLTELWAILTFQIWARQYQIKL